ncbi:helix-turn-helix transcriptional regulator [Anaerosphaera multitolerans]|uniref:Transcriptional regulator n=1 Tax=Anaerosphaera multitolerans TaxID=2487351 RepID=A0A437S6G8_9FIRM|nr:helix-turn-helix transcriptional regulator [Anaerosphaera multitolerans]RVU54591.1 transcriptional regulator [Anaerosphaera multitolerans]
MHLRNNLKMYRARENINQQEMGKMVGVSRQTISAIERGDYSPSVTLALEIAYYFKVPLEEIFYLEED